MEINPELLEKYGADTCSPEERRLVEDWLDEENAGSTYDLIPGTQADTEKEKIMAAVDTHLEKRKRRLLFRPASIAAVWVVLIGFGFYGYRIGMFTVGQTASAYETVQAPLGKKISVLLPDGTTVHLNSGTTLVYPKVFNGRERLLKLEGEAFFEVVKHEGTPFIVEAHGTRTEVLGTKFNLNSFEYEGQTKLSVEQGKVRFTASDSADTLLLVANNRATHEKGKLRMEEPTRHDDSGWKDGRLAFNQTPIADIIPVLERWYGVSITVSDAEINGYRVKLTYENPTLQRVLDDLTFATDLKFKIEGKTAIIYR